MSYTNIIVVNDVVTFRMPLEAFALIVRNERALGGDTAAVAEIAMQSLPTAIVSRIEAHIKSVDEGATKTAGSAG